MRRFNRRHVPLLAGATITGALLTIAALSFVWTPHVPTKMNIVAKLRPPLTQGLLGTDQFGRDILSRSNVAAP